ncbi:MAG: 2,3-bisphosphoglycerate-independent phosphoglycerate mutase, partial [Elusimicrobiales bacterium]|nr:2,3-bisphosphoglycerate-independent phosphoglycerate mutase [Elusimicrobiales bacterium]
MKKVLLIVRDGWGIGRDDDKYNAVKAAKTPNIDFYLKNYPNTILEASGEFVGLPKGY